MAWTIEISTRAEKSLERLQRDHAERLLRFLFDRVSQLDDPRSIGEALRGAKLAAFWKYRVGDYRIIAEIEDKILRIVVVQIGNRRDVYR
ncbi:MAG: RelE protein [Rhizobium sp.]|nr:RelE protein [Rhizobium sp.]